LLSQLNALEYQKDFEVGLLFDCNGSILKTSPYTDFEVKTVVSNKKAIKKIVQIKNFKELIQELKIEKSFRNFKNKKIKKLLSDTNINNYTLTYLIYVKKTNFERKLHTDIKDCNSTYINSIDIGGEFIALIHIKTKSQNEYKKIKKIKLTWQNLDKIEEIAKTNMVTFKNILITDGTFVSANNLKTLIKNAKSFSNDILHHEVPYFVQTNKNIEDTNQSSINSYLKALQTINNLEYIRRNQKEFSKENNNTTPTIVGKKIAELLTQQKMEEVDEIVKKVVYPKRFNAYNENLSTQIDKINLPSKKIERKYPKILEDVNISVNYNFDIKIRNRGKVVLLQWIKTVKIANKIIHEEENSKILFDSYINFKNLKASQFKGNNIGSIVFENKFDAYEKNSTINGNGIIDSANCSYKIVDQNGTLEIECNNIKLKKLDIKFEHEE
jgi:hypothetical protein